MTIPVERSAPPLAHPPTSGAQRFVTLDGWRATSIILVLLGHLFPLGPRSWNMNAPVAAMGMALFFILSGFLITRFLSERMDLRVFIIRRFFRIVPLAWTAMILLGLFAQAGPDQWPPNLLFYANLPPQRLFPGGSHLWSLCVEMQFYVGIAAFVAIAGPRALIGLPLVALGVTALRVAFHRHVDIVTWFRVDEILAGGILALTYGGWYGARPQRLLARLNPYWLLPVLLLSAHPAGGALNYARPYLAALTIGASLYGAPPLLARLFATRAAAYVAAVSYAVYIIHDALVPTWLGSGSTLVRYAKRPLLLGVTFALAHFSTYQFERRCIAFSTRISRRWAIRLPA